MSQSTIGAKAGALQKGADAVTAAFNTITDSAHRVEADLGELTGVWSGVSAVTYSALVWRWTNDATDLAQVLVTLNQALLKTAGDQAHTEQHQQNIVGTIVGDIAAMMGGK